MLSIAEYIAKRQKEDNLNEFDYKAKAENIRICVNYVFEYFNNYLDGTENESTILQSEKLQKYRNQLSKYEHEIQDWLVNIFNEYGKKMNTIINNLLKKQEFYLLYNTESEFRSLSYECYFQLVKKYPFLKEQTEMLFVYIKEHHAVISQEGMDRTNLIFSELINDWIETTWNKYHVNVLLFTNEWMDKFSGNETVWPTSHRKKSNRPWLKYEYDYKQESNLFNLNDLYKKLPKKPFIKGRKQELEMIMMYYWTHFIDDDEEYWDEYLKKTHTAV